MLTLERRSGRRGFSLIEMMLVMAIIGILVALVAAAVVKMAASVPRKNTELLIQKLNEALQKQWDAVIDTAKNETMTDPVYKLCMNAGNNDPAAARAHYIRFRLQQEFPESFAEARSGGKLKILPPKPAYVEFLKGVTLSKPKTDLVAASGGNTYQSSICLWMILNEARAGMDFDLSALSPRELRPVPLNANLRYISDHWGEPIRFYGPGDRMLDNPDIGKSGDSRGFPTFLLASAGPNKTTLPPMLDGAAVSVDQIFSSRLLIGK